MTPITDTFQFHRSFPLPPARMWTLLTAPEYREIWGAPGAETLEMLSSDQIIGGTERHRCGPADDPEFEVETRWYNLDAPTTGTYTEVIEAGGMRLGAALVTYLLAETDTGCDLSVTVAAVSFVGPEMIAEFNAGWTGSLANLDALVKAEAA